VQVHPRQSKAFPGRTNVLVQPALLERTVILVHHVREISIAWVERHSRRVMYMKTPTARRGAMKRQTADASVATRDLLVVPVTYVTQINFVLAGLQNWVVHSTRPRLQEVMR